MERLNTFILFSVYRLSDLDTDRYVYETSRLSMITAWFTGWEHRKLKHREGPPDEEE
jgi:hypothetical protein